MTVAPPVIPQRSSSVPLERVDRLVNDESDDRINEFVI